MKKNALADYVDRKLQELREKKGEHDTFAKENLVCPFCGHEHDPEDVGVLKQSSGLVKCGNCGEAFEFEAFTKKVYTTTEA